MTASIEERVQQFIDETEKLAEWTTTEDGKRAVLFLDEGEVIPLDDLAYSANLGFYRKSLFGEQECET